MGGHDAWVAQQRFLAGLTEIDVQTARAAAAAAAAAGGAPALGPHGAARAPAIAPDAAQVLRALCSVLSLAYRRLLPPPAAVASAAPPPRRAKRRSADDEDEDEDALVAPSRRTLDALLKVDQRLRAVLLDAASDELTDLAIELSQMQLGELIPR